MGSAAERAAAEKEAAVRAAAKKAAVDKAAAEKAATEKAAAEKAATEKAAAKTVAVEKAAAEKATAMTTFVPGYIERDSSLENFEELEVVQELIKEGEKDISHVDGKDPITLIPVRKADY